MAEPKHRCSICSHPSRLAIEQALINGKSQRAIARDFGIGSGEHGTESFRADHKKVQRHVERCMAEAYHRARESREIESGTAIADRLDYLDTAVTEVIERLRQGEVVLHDGLPVLNDDGTHRRRYKDTPLLMAINEARHNLDLRHKIAGAVADTDEDALAQARAALESPAARKAMAEVERVLAEQDGLA